jgi:hypothetical protein
MWRMGPNREKSNAYTVVVGKADGKRALWRPPLRWEEGTKIDLDIELEGV